MLSTRARGADLLVLGQVDPDERPYAAHHQPEEIVLACGRPVLILPHDGARATLELWRLVFEREGVRVYRKAS